MKTANFDFTAMLEHLTGVPADQWHDAIGPETGVGVDYFFVTDDGRQAQVNLDQDQIDFHLGGDHDDVTIADIFDLPGDHWAKGMISIEGDSDRPSPGL